MPQEAGLNYNSDVFEEQFPLVKRFVHHLTNYRALHAAYVEYRIQSEFWTHTIAHILQATINWCMVFGSDTRNPPIGRNCCKLSSTHSKLDLEMA